MLAYVVMVWTEPFSHVEGVGGRQRRVWMTGRPLAPSPVAIVVLSECYNRKRRERIRKKSLLRHACTTCGLGEGVDCVNL